MTILANQVKHLMFSSIIFSALMNQKRAKLKRDDCKWDSKENSFEKQSFYVLEVVHFYTLKGGQCNFSRRVTSLSQTLYYQVTHDKHKKNMAENFSLFLISN